MEACIASSYNNLQPRLQFIFLALCTFPAHFDENAAVALLLHDAASPPPPASPHAASPSSATPPSLSRDNSGEAGGQCSSPALLSLLRGVVPGPSSPSGGANGSGGGSGGGGEAGEVGRAEGGAAPGLGMEAAEVRRALGQLVEESMVELRVGRGDARRYRLHDLIRLFGANKLAQAEGGRAARQRWTRSLVKYYTGWLARINERGRFDDTSGSLELFDAERSNVEYALAQATDDQFPALLCSGRNLLRHRVDHGTRRSLLLKALQLIDEEEEEDAPAPAAAAAPVSPPRAAAAGLLLPSRAGSGVAEALPPRRLLPLLLIDLAYALSNASRFEEGTRAYACALRHAAGLACARPLLAEAGLDRVADPDGFHGAVLPPSEGTLSALPPPPPSPRPQAASAPPLRPPPLAALGGERPRAEVAVVSLESAGPTPAESAAAAAGGEEAAEAEFERQLEGLILDSGAAPTPEAVFAADSAEVVAEALNLLAVNLDCRGNERGSQLLFLHALRIRRRLFGPAHPEVASTYNNLANLLRSPLVAGGAGRAYHSGEVRAQVEALYRRAIAIRERVGPHSPQLAASLTNLSVLLGRSGDAADEAEAERLLRRGLAIRERVFGQEHPEVAHSLHSLANHYQFQRKDFTRAEGLYERALRMREQYYERNSDRVAQTLNCIAALKRAQACAPAHLGSSRLISAHLGSSRAHRLYSGSGL